jgi:hypothetical protein
VEAVAAAFTDYVAVVLRVSTAVPCTTRGKGYWRMNPTLFDDQDFVQNFKHQWGMWRSANLYLSKAMWWSRLVKRRISLLFSRAGVERCKEREAMENFYYDVLQD